MRGRRADVVVIPDIVALANQEREDQFCAQVAALSCTVSLEATRKGIHNYIINTRKRPKTKYEYNQERVRDFRVGKQVVTPATTEEVADDLEMYGKASYFLLQTDPVPFVRNYQYDVIRETIKMLDPSHSHFRDIIKVDISNQVVGDARFEELCAGIRRSSLKILNVSGNKLSNGAMQALAGVLRSMHYLEELSIARNKVTDEGIGELFSDKAYPSSLKVLDITFNQVGSLSAFYIGNMFKKERNCRLECLRLGGRLGRKGWGDEFVKVVFCAVVDHGLKMLKKLSLSDACLTSVGLDCVSALLVCDLVVLEELNISKNEFTEARSRTNFLNALRLNKSLKQLFIRECGFLEVESRHAFTVIRSNVGSDVLNRSFAEYSVRQQTENNMFKHSWYERASLALCAAAALNQCRHSHHRTRISLIKDNPWRIPGPPVWHIPKPLPTPPPNSPFISTSTASDLLSNVAVLFRETQVILPASIKAFLEDLNHSLRYADMIQEALVICSTLHNNPRSIKVSEAGQSCIAQIAQTIGELENGVSIALCERTAYSDMCKAAKERLFKELAQFRDDSEAVLRVAKRRERKNIKMIISDVSKRMNSDVLLFALEDYRCSITEECEALQRLIGCMYMQKLLHSCLSQEDSGEFFNFHSYLRQSLPYIGHLDTAATFVHYLYLAFPLERNDTKNLEDRALQQLMTAPLLLGAAASGSAAAGARKSAGGAGGAAGKLPGIHMSTTRRAVSAVSGSQPSAAGPAGTGSGELATFSVPLENTASSSEGEVVLGEDHVESKSTGFSKKKTPQAQ
jgi:hypothetical protein